MKTNIDFYGNRNKIFMVSLFIIAIGLIFNFFFGTRLDMKFTGGATIKYSYSGEIDTTKIDKIAENLTGKSASVELNAGLDSKENKSLSLAFAGTSTLPIDQQQGLTSALLQEYPDGNFSIIESNSIDPSMGQSFFLKCILCVLITIAILIVYIAFRFKKIGGFSAGVMAIIALLHDLLIIYFTFIIFKMPLNDNFIAVVLTILGYSLNDTIVIYDRIRENRKSMAPNTALHEVVNLSINQTLGRSIMTSATTFAAITVVFVVGLIYNLPSITTFALPMMVGVFFGCYSSIFIAGPLYAMWKERKPKAALQEK